MPTRHKLNKLTIRGFYSIQWLEDFELNDLNLLIGPNGSGKSNFVAFFKMLGELAEQRLAVWVNAQGGADRIVSFGVKQTNQLSAMLWFGRNGYEFTLLPTVDSRLIFREEWLHFDDGSPIQIGVGHDESRLAEERVPGEWRRADYVYDSISSWKVYHFHDTSDSAGVKRPGSIDDNQHLRTDASNLAAYLLRLRRTYPDVYKQVRRTVQLALPFFGDFVLRPQPDRAGNELVRLNWRHEGSDYPMWPSQLSDGALRFVCLTTALLQPDPPSTLIIDEPELGLHPYAIRLLGSLIRSASKRMQVIVSTQSVPLVDEFELSDLIVVERDHGASVFNRLDVNELKHWLDDYTLGELWEKNILGGRPR
ncbi:MAG: AAA family ATPase [Chloroflexi bacterium]|nr:AAA family ATPase [Chloroflexota bacterium]